MSTTYIDNTATNEEILTRATAALNHGSTERKRLVTMDVFVKQKAIDLLYKVLTSPANDPIYTLLINSSTQQLREPSVRRQGASA